MFQEYDEDKCYEDEYYVETVNIDGLDFKHSPFNKDALQCKLVSGLTEVVVNLTCYPNNKFICSCIHFCGARMSSDVLAVKSFKEKFNNYVNDLIDIQNQLKDL